METDSFELFPLLLNCLFEALLLLNLPNTPEQWMLLFGVFEMDSFGSLLLAELIVLFYFMERAFFGQRLNIDFLSSSYPLDAEGCI